MRNNSIPIVTIDGPSGAGKGVLSKKLALILGWNLLDSGVIYRVLASIALDRNVSINNKEKIEMFVSDMRINFVKKENQFIVYCNNKEVKRNIYTETIGNFASKIAMSPKIRTALLIYQRTFHMTPGLIADGRDMGTMVFPNSEGKIFLDASFRIRGQRRLDQLQKTNFNVNFELLSSHMKERDNRDYYRKIAPLKPAIGSLILDSTNLSQNEVKNRALAYIEKKLISLNIKYKIMHNQG